MLNKNPPSTSAKLQRATCTNKNPKQQTTEITRANPEKLKSWLNPKIEKYTHARAPKKDKKVGWFHVDS